METPSFPMISLRVTFRSCFSSTRKPRSNGKPASTSVASWRVKMVRTFGFTLPLRPGILMLMLMLTPFFRLCPCRRPCPWPAFILGLVHLDHLGREIAHFLEPPDGFVLVGDIQGSLGFLPSGIHGHVAEFRHKRLARCILRLLQWLYHRQRCHASRLPATSPCPVPRPSAAAPPRARVH